MAHAYPPFHNAGAEMTLHAMLGALWDEGHEVHVLLSRESDAQTDYEFEGVHVHVRRGDGDPFPWFRGPERADVVLAHLENTPRASALGQMYGVPVVHLLHNNHLWTKRCLYRQPPQLAVFNTEWMAQDYRTWWDRTTHRSFPHSTVVLPAVDPVPFTTTASAGHRDITLINLNEDKGAVLFWNLADLLPERRFLGVVGAYGQQLDAHLPPLPNVEIMGHRKPSGMPAVYARTKVLLMPSAYESYGRTAIEACLSGVPVIAHPTPGLREALGDAATFADREDTDAWLTALRRLLTPKGWAKASKTAFDHASALTPEKDLLRFVDEIEKVVRRGVGFAR